MKISRNSKRMIDLISSIGRSALFFDIYGGIAILMGINIFTEVVFREQRHSILFYVGLLLLISGGFILASRLALKNLYQEADPKNIQKSRLEWYERCKIDYGKVGYIALAFLLLGTIVSLAVFIFLLLR